MIKMSRLCILALFFIVLLFNSSSLFFTEEFIIFINLSLFFFLLYKVSKKNISKYFFLRVEFIYFCFTYLILVNLILIDKLRLFISNFFFRFKMIYHSELPLATSLVLQKIIQQHLKNNTSFIKNYTLIFISSLFKEYCNKSPFFSGNDSIKIYSTFFLFHYLVERLICKT